ncbi:putative RNA-directed DNA polymerase from transposon BS [Trichonephila clavata]|uniref:Putative RNA-directed DNA polymerase from transposon BS n=1 Tax=Trichonephila clavata TaxID=2740835 RepID=A0A8X6IQP3_TRICU|nr:putative RNA-directed DNA polymerase from transposon BS [Trichonephila clavata]
MPNPEAFKDRSSVEDQDRSETGKTDLQHTKYQVACEQLDVGSVALITITNGRGSKLSKLVNDKAFLSLNDGIHTFHSNSYGSTDVLDLTFISPDLFPYSSWRVLDNIGSDHLPILVEIDLKVHRTGVKNLHWNFKKVGWSLFEDISNDLISKEPNSDNLKKQWSHFKHSIFTAAKSSIPRGERSKQTRSFFVHNSDIKPLIAQRAEPLKVIAPNGGLDRKNEVNKLNAEIKKISVQFKRSNWQNLCETLDYRTLNTKLGKLAKQIDNLKPNNEEINAIISNNGHIMVKMTGKWQRPWLSTTQMKVDLILIVLTNT